MIAAWLLLAAGITADTVTTHRVAVAPGESLSVEIHTSTLGRGDQVVLIPGFFGGAYGFRRLVPMLEHAGYQPVIVEPLGTGASSHPSRGDYSFLTQADRIAAALDSSGIHNAWIIAHSAGGAMALRLAYRRPDLVRGLLSLEGGPTERVSTPEFRRAASVIPWVRMLGGIKVIRRVVRRTLVASSGDPSWITDAVVEGYTAAAAADVGGILKVYLAMANSRERDQLMPHLRAIACPVRLLIGTAQHDGAVEQAELDEMRALVRDFAVEPVPGAGHYLQEERPEAIVAALRRMTGTVDRGPGTGDR